MPGDITNWLEESAVEDTLVAPLHSAYEQQPESSDYLEGDDQETAELQDAELQQPEFDAQQDDAELSQEEQAALIEQQEAFESLPEAEQFRQCTEALDERYAEIQADLDPQTCRAWAAKLAADSGFPGAESHFDSVMLATVAEGATSNFEETLRYHPAAPAFQEAVSDYYALTPEQRATPEGQKLYDAAVRAAMPLNSRMMALTVLSDLGVVFKQPNLPRSGNPIELVSKLEVELAEDAGWLFQPQRETQEYDSPFKTNADLFDSEAMEEIARRGLL